MPKYSSYKKTHKINRYLLLKIKNKILITIYFIIPLLGTGLFSTNTFADYMPMERGGSLPYYILLKKTMPVSRSPSYGTNGQAYYQVGHQMVVGRDLSADSHVSNGNGLVACFPEYQSWSPGGINLSSSATRWKKGHISAPTLGFSIAGVPAYRLSRDITMTITASDPQWTRSNAPKTAEACYPPMISKDQNMNFSTLDSYFYVTFYIKGETLDNQFVLYRTQLGYLDIAFTAQPSAPQPTAPYFHTAVVVVQSVDFNVPAVCSTTTSSGGTNALNLNHGTINASLYDSSVSGKVTYKCNWTRNQPISIRLEYTKDSDSMKRLPLSYGSNKIYSTLSMTDDTTGRTYPADQAIKMDIKDLSSITITSHLQGSNSVAGNYSGTAWLISTFD